MATDESALTPRAAETLRLVRELRNPNRTELASRLGCSPNTAAQYTAELRAAGLIHPTSAGRFARWRCSMETTPPLPKPRSTRTQASAPAEPSRLLEQVSSVWHYAQRCARKEKR